MSLLVKTDIDFGGNQALGLRLETLSGNPVANVVEGRIYYDSSSGTKRPVVYDGTSWKYICFKDELDSMAQSLAPKDSVRCATTVDLAGGTYANGTNGVGATITFGSAQTIDTIAIAAGDRVLVKNQSVGGQNGLYIATTQSLLTRSDDANTWEELRGAMVYVEDGATMAGALWVCSNKKGGTIDGTQAVNFTIFNKAEILTFGGGLQKVANAVSIQTVNNTKMNADNYLTAGGINGSATTFSRSDHKHSATGTFNTTLIAGSITIVHNLGAAALAETFVTTTGEEIVFTKAARTAAGITFSWNAMSAVIGVTWIAIAV